MTTDLRKCISDKPYLKELTDALNSYCTMSTYDKINCPEVLAIFEKNHVANGDIIKDFLLFKVPEFWQKIGDTKEYFLILLDVERCQLITAIVNKIFKSNITYKHGYNMFTHYAHYSNEQLTRLVDISKKYFTRVINLINSINELNTSDIKYITPDIISILITNDNTHKTNVINAISGIKEFAEKYEAATNDYKHIEDQKKVLERNLATAIEVINARDTVIANYEKKLSAKHDDIAYDDVIANYEKKIATYHEENDKLTTDIRTLKIFNENNLTHINTLKTKNEELSTINGALIEEVEKNKKELVKYYDALCEREKDVDSLNEKIEYWFCKSNIQSNEIIQLNKKITEYESKLNRLNDLITNDSHKKQ